MADEVEVTTKAHQSGRARIGAVWLVVFASLLTFSAIRSPVPGVNEPHYLAKAKHYWDPAWCAGDFFLESSNAHLVFYLTVGTLTKWFTLDATAWISRFVALGILAWGWIGVHRRIHHNRWLSVWSLWMYLALAAVGNWSGEWMVGGIEGKVFAYGLGFWAIGAFGQGLLKTAGLLAGLSVSFHPVVGCWMLVAGIAATFAERVFQSSQATERFCPKISLKECLLAAGVFLLAALPGLFPVFELLTHQDARQANIVTRIQVFYRIRHHLDPMTFSQYRNASYGLMIILWLLLRTLARRTTGERWFAWFTGASIVIALTGFALGYGERPIESLDQITWRYRLLKFYPFRLADILVPMALSISTAGVLQRIIENREHERFRSWRVWLVFASLFAFSLLAPAIDRNPSRMKPNHLADWIGACRWIRSETPADAVIWTPKNSWAFKWYAHRAEYVSRKDCPQDAEGIIEWNRRMRQQLPAAFEEEPRLNHAILRIGRGSLPIQPIYENDHYRIYDLSSYRRN